MLKSKKNSEAVVTHVETMQEPEMEEVVYNVGGEQNGNLASTEVMDKALNLVARKFKLDGEFIMTGFKDTGSKCEVTMASQDYEVKATIKNQAYQRIQFSPNSEE